MTTYHTEIDLRNPNSSHAQVAALVDSAPRVLDVGCSTGYLGRVLASLGSRVRGLEVDAQAAARAREVLDEVVEADLDHSLLHDHYQSHEFDAVVFADVLEHLRDPVQVLRDASDLLAPDGRVVVSIPNVSHAAVRLALLQGRWEYTDTGILDRTHVSFYTRPGLLQLAQDAGMEVVDLRATVLDPLEAPIRIDVEALPRGIVEWVRHQPDALCYQFVAALRPQRGEVQSGGRPELVPALPLEKVRRRDGHTASAARLAVHERADLLERDGLRALQAEVGSARTRLEEVERQLKRARAETTRAKEEIDAIRRSRTWRAGRLLTAPRRALRSGDE